MIFGIQYPGIYMKQQSGLLVAIVISILCRCVCCGICTCGILLFHAIPTPFWRHL